MTPYIDARDAAIDEAMTAPSKPSKGALTPEEKARCIKLLAQYGPPSEWSGSVAASMSPEDRALCMRGWKQLSKDEQAAITAKFEAGMAEGAAEEATPENIDSLIEAKAKSLDSLSAGKSKPSMDEMRNSAIDKAMSMKGMK